MTDSNAQATDAPPARVAGLTTGHTEPVVPAATPRPGPARVNARALADGRDGDGWILTASGRPFWPLEPRASEVHLEDIAHALALECRFGNQTRTADGSPLHYSVAQHSVLCALQAHPRIGLAVLLHDAAEAYWQDVQGPVKRSLRRCGIGILGRIEERLQTAIHERFGLPAELPAEVAHEIKRIDRLLLATEARDLMAPLPEDWVSQEANGWPVLPEPIVPWSPVEAKARFLGMFDALTARRSET